MAKKKSTDDFRKMERETAEKAASAAMERIKRGRDAAEETRRRKYLVNRTMDQIVEAMMTPPDAVNLPTDFAAAWASDRSLFLKLIDRPLTAEETKGVAGAMATLMEHNRRLRLLARDLVKRLAAVSGVIDDRVISLRNSANSLEEAATSAMRAGEDYLEVEED